MTLLFCWLSKSKASPGPHGDAQLRNCMQGGKQSETKEVTKACVLCQRKQPVCQVQKIVLSAQRLLNESSFLLLCASQGSKDSADRFYSDCDRK